MLWLVSPFAHVPELQESCSGFVGAAIPNVLSFAAMAVVSWAGFEPNAIEAPACCTAPTVEPMVESCEELNLAPETFSAVAEAEADTIAPVFELETVVISVVTLTVETTLPFLS